jgi:hypothetical protein
MLSEEARDRLADIVDLQPTKNAELREHWGMDSGSDVHAYLESELREYYYRNADSLICATPEAVELVGGDPDPREVTLSELEARAFEVVAGPEDRAESVVSVLHSLRDAYDIDPDAEAVRRALRSLERRGLVRTVQRAVPTFHRAVEREDVTVHVEADAESGDGSGPEAGETPPDADDAGSGDDTGGDDAEIIDEITGEFDSLDS